MTVMRVPSGALVVHSPTDATDETLAELRGLGDVVAIIAPSWWHDLYLGKWLERVPSAALYAAPAVVRAQPSLPVGEVLGDEPPALWSGVIDQVQVRGLGLYLDEFAFYHRASRSLILGDLIFNYDDADAPLMKTVARYVLGSYPGVRFATAFRPAVRDRANLRATIERILEWDFQRIVPVHGAVVESDAKEAFRGAFGWLGIAP